MNNPLRLDQPDPVAFLPGLQGDDPIARYWVRQVTLRLRRELSWLWRERRLQGVDGGAGSLPPFVERSVAALDLLRYDADRRAFFADDVTARFLGERLAAGPPQPRAAHRGSFGWVVQALDLAPVECFVLALALLPTVDSAAGPVIAACLNDPARSEPTLALAQRLWDEPDELLYRFDPGYALLRHGLLRRVENSGAAVGPGPGWHAPLVVPPLVARELLFAGGELPAALKFVSSEHVTIDNLPLVAARVARAAGEHMRIVPVIGAPGSGLAE